MLREIRGPLRIPVDHGVQRDVSPEAGMLDRFRVFHAIGAESDERIDNFGYPEGIRLSRPWICGPIGTPSSSTSHDQEAHGLHFMRSFNSGFQAKCPNAHWHLSLQTSEKRWRIGDEYHNKWNAANNAPAPKC